MTVVFQSGLGDGSSPWRPVATEVSRNTRTFIYDRPGYGASPKHEGPRDPVSTAEALHRTLEDAGLKPPYLLVGHSLGGLYHYCFAKLYPDEVAGMVLLDPTHPRHWATMQVEAPAAASLLRGLRATLFSSAAKAEFDQQEQRLSELNPLPLKQIPTTVLVRTEYQAIELGRFEAMVHTLEQDWLQRLGHARLFPVENSGHYIQKDQPQRVTQEILALLKAVERSPRETTREAH